MCVRMVQQKVDAVAGEVVTAMLQLSRPHETRLQEDRSAPLAETAISAAVAEAIESGRSSQLSPEKVTGMLCVHLAISIHPFFACLTPLFVSSGRRRPTAPGCRYIRGTIHEICVDSSLLTCFCPSRLLRALARATAVLPIAST